MQIPVLFGCIMVFIIWLQYEIRKSKKQIKNSQDRFWKMEQNANSIRKVDISNLNYISIPFDKLPLLDLPDATINDYRDTIQALSDKKILNLSGITNTDLKFQYGTANIKQLEEYDNNYTKLVSILHKWGERLYTLNYIDEAVIVLEFATTCLTDVSKTYKLLAQIYREQNSNDKINTLISIIPNTKIYRKENIINILNTIKNS